MSLLEHSQPVQQRAELMSIVLWKREIARTKMVGIENGTRGASLAAELEAEACRLGSRAAAVTQALGGSCLPE